MSASFKHPEIEIVSDVRGEDGKRQPCCRLTCASCGAVERQWIIGGLSSEHSAKFFTRLGWALGSKPECPDCQTARRNKPLKEKPKMTVVPIKGEPQARPLTPDERTKVRNQLEGCFDEQRGVYLDGQSDQSIGLKLNLPWASVRDYREVAFGPLKGNEETAALKVDIDKLTADLAALMSRSSKEIGEVASAKDKLAQRLSAIEKRLGFA